MTGIFYAKIDSFINLQDDSLKKIQSALIALLIVAGNLGIAWVLSK
jgi:hypothetical protein